MGKKTIVPVKSRGYKVVTGDLEISPGEQKSTTITFPGKVAIILYRTVFSTTATGTTKYGFFNYKYNKSNSFFNPFAEAMSQTLPSSNPSAYMNDSSRYVTSTKIDDYTYQFEIDNNYYITHLTYLAVLEDNLEDEIRPIFLLNGTIVHTDGEITPEVADSVQTLETNKYKIKANTLVNISNATYINLSN